MAARLGRLRVPLAEAHEGDTTGVGHIAYRAAASPRRWRAGRRRSRPRATRPTAGPSGDLGHGRAFRFEDPFGHVFEIYWDTSWYEPQAEAERAALKNTASAFTGAAPRRLDHVNLLAEDVTEFRRFMETCLGCRVTEMIRLDNGRHRRLLVHRQQQDLRSRLHRGARRRHGRLHHVTYATDQREDILRAADIFLQNGVHIETGPHKHAIQGTFFLYVWEPAGNRVELANAGARLILAPDWQPVVWTEADRRKGQAWGLRTIESFHTHGTPPVKAKAEA